MKTNRLNPEIFELAASLIRERGFACVSIETACESEGVRDKPYLDFFAETLCPNLAIRYSGWYSCYHWSSLISSREIGYERRHEKNARVFGLLLCAELIREAMEVNK